MCRSHYFHVLLQKWRPGRMSHSDHKGKKAQKWRHLCPTHLSHSQTSPHQSTTAKRVTYTLCGTTNLLLKGLSTLHEHLHDTCGPIPCPSLEKRAPLYWQWFQVTPSVCLHHTGYVPILLAQFSFWRGPRGDTDFTCIVPRPPQEVNVISGPSSLGKVAVWLNIKFRFFETEFKEILSYTGKKKKLTGGVKIKHQPGRISCLPHATLSIVLTAAFSTSADVISSWPQLPRKSGSCSFS